MYRSETQASDRKSAVAGYLLLVSSLYALLFILGVVENHFFDPSPQPLQDVWWLGALVIFLLLGIPVALGHFFGRVSYLGVGLCLLFCLAAPAQFIGQRIASQVSGGAEVALASPWYLFLAPSLAGVTALFVCRYITSRSKVTRRKRRAL